MKGDMNKQHNKEMEERLDYKFGGLALSDSFLPGVTEKIYKDIKEFIKQEKQLSFEAGARAERIKALEWVLIQTGRWTEQSDIGIIQLSSVPLDRIIADEIVKQLSHNTK